LLRFDAPHWAIGSLIHGVGFRNDSFNAFERRSMNHSTVQSGQIDLAQASAPA